MEKNKIKINSLNTVLPEIYLDEMERRLETDPLTLGGIVDLIDEEGSCGCHGNSGCQCNKLGESCVGKWSCDIDDPETKP